MIGNKIEPFKFWCQKVLPNVYDDSLSYYEYLCKLNEYLNEVIEQMNTLTEAEEQFQTHLTGEWEQYSESLTEEWNTTKEYIDNYFDNLDVQEEINNKLDVMASDGTLDALLLPYFNTYKAEINQIVATQNQTITTQNNRLTVLEGRMDGFASLPDGSTSGDAELLDIRIGANGVTYPNAGDAVRGQYDELKTDIDGVLIKDFDWTEGYIVWGNSNGRPSANANYKYSEFVKVDLHSKYFFNMNGIFVEFYDSNSFESAWRGQATASQLTNGITPLAPYMVVSCQLSQMPVISVVDDMIELINEVVKKGNFTQIARETVTVDTLPNGIASFTATSAPTNMPNINYGNGAMIATIRNNDNALSNWDKQYIITDEYIATRTYYNNAWLNWTIKRIDNVKSLGNVPPTLANLDNGVYYIMSSASAPSDYPPISFAYGAIISVFRQTNGTNSNYDTYIIKTPQVTYRRTYVSGVWTDWSPYDGVITCGNGKDFTRLRDAIYVGCIIGCKVRVYEGTYDLTQEFATEIAAAPTTGWTGNKLKNGIHVEFLAGSYVTAIFDGSNTWALTYFNPFYSEGDFTLEGLNIEAKNCRYCVHDEHAGSDVNYHHKYINCFMHFINTVASPSYVQCIGGGLGYHGVIDIEGGLYHTETTNPVSGYSTADDSQIAISYHNGVQNVCDSKITIKNLYIKDKGFIRLGNYGASIIKSHVLICGCSYGKDVQEFFENPNLYQNVNFEVTKWNNTVRT